MQLADLVSAGIVLALAESQPSLVTKFDMNLVEASWIAATETLLRMAQMVHPSAKDYAIALQAMRQRSSGRQIGKMMITFHENLLITIRCKF